MRDRLVEKPIKMFAEGLFHSHTMIFNAQSF